MGKIIIGADHAGFGLKGALKSYLTGRGWEVADVGTFGEASVDYPDFAGPVAARAPLREVEPASPLVDIALDEP